MRGLALNDRPEIFGLHENANISFANGETNRLLGMVLSLQPRESGGEAMSADEKLIQLATELEARVPAPFNVDDVAEKFPISYENSMNTILQQELMRFNALLVTAKQSLGTVKRAVNG